MGTRPRKALRVESTSSAWYFEERPGHAARLDHALDQNLKTRWSDPAKQHNVSIPATAANRGDWIRAAFDSQKPTEYDARFEGLA